jgi:hypothetical protein
MAQIAKPQIGDRSPPPPEIFIFVRDYPLKILRGEDLEPSDYLLDPDTEMELELMIRYGFLE